MQKFKYKLEALLKLRELEENKLQIELGRINQELLEKKNLIKKHNQDLAIGYSSMEKMLKEGTSARYLQFYPMHTEGHNAAIEKLENEIYSLKEKLKRKVEEVAKAKAAVDVVKKMKEKAKVKFKREIEKKDQEKIDELVQIWRSRNVEV